MASSKKDTTSQFIASQAKKGSGTPFPHSSPNAPELYRVANCRIPLPPPIRRKARGIWNLLERSWAVDREIARLERAERPFDVVEITNWGAESLCYSFHPRAPLVIRLSTPLAQVSFLKGDRSNRVGLRLACFLEALPARRGACIIANSEFIAQYCADLYRISKAKPVVIPHGISVPASRAGRAESARERGNSSLRWPIGETQRDRPAASRHS